VPSVKEKMTEVIQAQPDDATYEEIMRSLRSNKWPNAALTTPARAKLFQTKNWGAASPRDRNEVGQTVPSRLAPGRGER
jgi:hypothetical protein